MDRCRGHGDQWGVYGYSLGEACTKTPDSGHDSQATKSEVQKYFSIFFFLFQYLFIYLAASGLNCGTWDILVAECGIVFSCSMWDLDPWPGSNSGPVHWVCGVLATGPPGNTLRFLLNQTNFDSKPSSYVSQGNPTE